MIRVLVADYTRIHTRLLADALMRHADLQVTPFESDCSGLVAAAAAHNIDVLVVSSNLDEQPSRGLDLMQELRAVRPEIRSVLLLGSSKDEAVVRAFRAGARGVFGRNEPLDLLSKCVRCVYKGEIWANTRQVNVAISALADSPTVRAVNAEGMNLLSARELEVVCCLAEGLTNREIGERLKLSQHTIKNYLFRVFNKLGVSSRVELLSMTLTRQSQQRNTGLGKAKELGRDIEASPSESGLMETLAEAALPAAQLAVAQQHLARGTRPQDLIDAYASYLVASERARQAQELMTNRMTPQQVEEAKRKASKWAPTQPASAAGSLDEHVPAESNRKA